MKNSSHFKVRFNTLIPDKALNFDLYLKLGDKLTLYLRKGDKVDKAKINLLQTRDSGQNFFVQEANRSFYRSYLKENMNSLSLDTKEKALILRESSMALVEELFENPDLGMALANSKPIVAEFISFMKSDPSAMSQLISLSGHDFYTYNHSLDVSIYSLGLGEALGFSGPALEELGQGALLHDIGKREVNLDILCKKGPLDEAEWSQMQKHPQYGLLLMNDIEGLTEGIKAACFEHHESWSGNGYPQQLTRDEIHPFARIVAITDTYDAMTTQRSYNVPLRPIEAVTMICEKLAARYDPEMIKAMGEILFKMKAA